MQWLLLVAAILVCFAAVTWQWNILGAGRAPQQARTLVSAVMPTKNRPLLVEWAIKQLGQQQLPDNVSLELIVVDQSESCHDGGDGKLGVAGERGAYNISNIVHRCCAPDLTVGQMRNLAVELARGEFIVHVDDDELYRSDRIVSQLRTLSDHSADLTALPWAKLLHAGGSSSCYVTDFEPLPVPEDSDDPADEEIVHAPHYGSLMYRRIVWAGTAPGGGRAPVLFPHSSFAEDYQFFEDALERGYRFEMTGRRWPSGPIMPGQSPEQDTDGMLHVRHLTNANGELTEEARQQMRKVPAPDWAAPLLPEFCRLVQRQHGID